MRSNELTPSVTLENLPIPEEEKLRLAEIKLECENLWQKVEESEGVLKAKGRQYDYESIRFLYGDVIQNIYYLSQSHSPVEVEDRIRKIELTFAAFREEYTKVESMLKSSLPSLNNILMEGKIDNKVVPPEGGDEPAVEGDVSAAALQKAIDDTQMTVTPDTTPPTVPMTIDELLLAAGFKNDFDDTNAQLGEESNFANNSIKENRTAEKSVDERTPKIKGASSGIVKSFSDLKLISGIDDLVVRNEANDEQEKDRQHCDELFAEASATHQELVDRINQISEDELRGAKNGMFAAEKVYQKILSLYQSEMTKESIQELEYLTLQLQDFKLQLEEHLIRDMVQEGGEYAGDTVETQQITYDYSSEDSAQTAALGMNSGIEDAWSRGGGAAGLELTESSLLEKSPSGISYDPEAFAETIDRSLAVYRKWQNGDPSLFPRNHWIHALKKVRRDIALTLKAAGYSQKEIYNFIGDTVLPWSQSVVEEARKTRREKSQPRWGEFRDQILTAVKEKIAGREPDSSVFRDYHLADSQMDITYHGERDFSFDLIPELLLHESTLSNETHAAPSEEGNLDESFFGDDKTAVSIEVDDRNKDIVGVGESSQEVSNEPIPTIEEEKKIFADTKEELVRRGLHIKFHYAIQDIERHIDAIERIGADEDMPTAKKVARITQRRDVLHRLLNETITEAFSDAPAHPTETPAMPTPETVVENTSAKDEAVGELRKQNPVKPIGRGPALAELDTNADVADMWRQSRREFSALKDERHKARAAYYEREARSVMGKVRSVAKIFGFKPELPPELQAIETKYEAARKNHAAILSQMDRVKEKFDLSTTAGKRAFAQHFVLNPHLRQQQLQAQVLEKVDNDAKYTAAVKNVLAGLRKYKWHTRVGTVVAVAALGAATGGVAAGGFAALTAAGRMAASTGVGALAAFVTREGMQARVEKREGERDAARKTAETEFSLDALEELEAKFISADTAVTLTKKRKDVVTVAAAFAGGLSAGAGVTALAAAEAAPTVLSEVVPHKSLDLFDRLSVETSSLDGSRIVVSDIDLVAAKESVREVSEITRQLLKREAELAISDILYPHKNMPAAQVEGIVLERLQNKFGHEGWWQRAEVKAISIGSITEAAADTAAAGDKTIGVEAAVSDNLDYGALNEASTTPATSLYEVKSGDTLWKIMENKYADSVLKNLSEAEKNRVLDALFDKARADAALRESIGLNPRAGGSIDKLWPGDTLNTAGLETELKKIVAGTEALPARPRTGALPIEVEQGERPVPITNRTNIPPQYPSVQSDAPVIPVYADPAYINPVHTGVPFGTEGAEFDVPIIPDLPTLSASVPNYLETTEYKNIIEGLFGGQNEFNRAVGVQVQALEAGTYDFMNRLLQDFKSPYSTKLRFEYDGPTTDVTLAKMTLAEIQQLRTEYKDPFAMREFAQMNGFKYETLDAWFKKIDDLKVSSNLPYSDKTTLADLFGRSVAKETLERQFNAAYEAKQLAKK